MARDIVRLMQALFLPGAQACKRGIGWQPSADLYRTSDGWLVKFDLAGIRPEEIRLTLEGSDLTVSGCRHDRVVEQGHQYYRMEIAYSQFERTIELPCRLDPASISTEYRDGMLLVSVRTEGEVR